MKSNLLYILLLVGLFGCLIFDLVIQSSFSYLAFCYFVLFCFVAIFLIVRGFVYKIDTNLYFGILLLISPIVQTLIYFGIKNYSYYCVGVFLPLTLPSVITPFFLPYCTSCSGFAARRCPYTFPLPSLL